MTKLGGEWNQVFLHLKLSKYAPKYGSYYYIILGIFKVQLAIEGGSNILLECN